MTCGVAVSEGGGDLPGAPACQWLEKERAYQFGNRPGWAVGQIWLGPVRFPCGLFFFFISFFLFYLLISGFIQIFCKFDSIQIKQIPKIF
jgi:hypothetical protein